MKLKDKVAIVTGGARGIGLAIARRFIAEGAHVAIADIAPDPGIGAEFHHCDVSNSNAVHATVKAVLKAHGAIDILVNNAAISVVADFLELSEADFDRVLAVNLKGSFLMLQACARAMVAQVSEGRAAGAIVNMSSVNETLAIPAIVPYCASKGAIAQLTRATSIYLAPHGIRVNAIGPGSINTDMLKGVVGDPAAMNRVLSRTPLGRIGEPEEIAAIAAFLASDEASYITGQTIFADGGRMPLNYTVAVKGT
jgi:glucose 1-dehydrogenase